MNEAGASSIFGERVHSPVCIVQTDRIFGTRGHQFVVPHYFNTEENLIRWPHAPHIVLWCGRDELQGEERISIVVEEAEVGTVAQ